LTHTRLFTRSSLRRLLKETGFVVEKESGIPFPAPLYFHNRAWQSWLMKIQLFLIEISQGLFCLPDLHRRPRPADAGDASCRSSSPYGRQSFTPHGGDRETLKPSKSDLRRFFNRSSLQKS
jgi:hypothetical protein